MEKLELAQKRELRGLSFASFIYVFFFFFSFLCNLMFCVLSENLLIGCQTKNRQSSIMQYKLQIRINIVSDPVSDPVWYIKRNVRNKKVLKI